MGAADDERGHVETTMERRQCGDESAALEVVKGGAEIGAVEEVDEGVGVADGSGERDLTEVLFEGARALGDSFGVKVLEKALRWDGDGSREGRNRAF